MYPSRRESAARLRDYSAFKLERNKFRDLCANPLLLDTPNSKVSFGSVPVAGRTLVRMQTEERENDLNEEDWLDYDRETVLSDNSVCFDLKVSLSLEKGIASRRRRTRADSTVSATERRTPRNIYCKTKSDLVSQIMEITMCGKDPRKDCKLNVHSFTESNIKRRLPTLAVVLPGEGGGGPRADEDEEEGRSQEVECPYFHVDETGKSCFSKEEAARASRRIVEIDLVNQVQRKILTTNFVLPQVKKTVDATFCNESVYGKMNFLMVTGLVRLG